MLNLIIVIIISEISLITIFFLSKIRLNIIILFLLFELVYILVLSLILFTTFSSNLVIPLVFFLYIIALSTSKTVIGICLLINYIKVYNTVNLNF